jgi:hypothetical protein
MTGLSRPVFGAETYLGFSFGMADRPLRANLGERRLYQRSGDRFSVNILCPSTLSHQGVLLRNLSRGRTIKRIVNEFSRDKRSENQFYGY